MLSLIFCFTFGCAKKNALPKNDFPPEFAEEFTEGCLQGGGSVTACQCTVEKIMTEIPSSEFENGSDNVSVETFDKITTLALSCISIDELKKQINIGCLQSSGDANMCECKINKIVGQYTREELINLFLEISEGYNNEEFTYFTDNAELECMDPQIMKKSFVDSCAEESSISYCECVYDGLYNHFGEMPLKKHFYEVGLGGKPQELYDALEIYRAQCSQ
jgi:hypothetical protein